MTVLAETRARLDRIAAEDGDLRTFIRVDRDAALTAAAAADERAATGQSLGPLDGLAVAVKDNMAVAGTACTGGVAGLATAVAPTDSNAITRLRDAGAVILGGLNMHEAALGGTTDNAAFGRCQNPLAPGYTPGGSSGGSGAAVATGFVDLALGSDTMGSVRLPAAYCGVYGIKPTPGLIGRSGFVYLSPALDTIGPLARDPALLWPSLQALAGSDPGDPECVPPPAGWGQTSDDRSLSGMRIGVPTQLENVDCESQVLDGSERAKQALTDMGADVVPVDLSDWDPGRARLAGLIAIEAEGAVELADLIEQPGAMTPTLQAMLRFGRDMPTAKLVRALATVRAAGAACIRALNDVDALMLPTAPQRAFPHDGPAPVNQADLTALANFAGCPAIAIPVASQGLPASVQIIGQPWAEADLCSWAQHLGPALA